MTAFNLRGTWAIFTRELMRAFRTAFQSILSPVLTTSLYFIVFGSAIGNRMPALGGVEYAAFIIPGLLMLTLLGETRSEEHTSELQSLMRISYAVFCLKKKKI